MCVKKEKKRFTALGQVRKKAIKKNRESFINQKL